MDNQNFGYPLESTVQIPRSVSTDSILHIINLFLDRLHASMPFFERSYLVDNIHAQRPLYDQSFNALIHAVSALTVFQMMQKGSENTSSAVDIDKAEWLLAEAVRLHSHADFGENPVLEHVLTSVFLFGCQFSKGNHHAARFRLREAITLAETMGLDDPQTYENISRDEKNRRLRTFLCLTVIHRVYAIQRDSPINDYLLTSSRLHIVRTTLTQLSTNSGQPDEKVVAGLGYMVDLIDFVDSTFVKCWRNQCWKEQNPTHISARSVSMLLQRHTEPMSTHKSPNDAQRADVLVTRHWICHILWDLGSRHGFLHAENTVVQMRPDYALTIARDSIDTCESLDMTSLECHGVGLVEKLYDIVTSAIKATQPTELGPAMPHLSSSAAPGQDREAVLSWPVVGSVIEPALNEGERSTWHEEIVCPKSTPRLADFVNRFLVIFSSFRGGKHPYLKPYMRMLYELDLV
ncbi:hypothetical protein COCC4DRAFT_66376 [Bipolaris maydis ATCC 48331]|uniref:Transcription factor domain-containing protein n=1 Tax=Cochliobolus heterostrophus (strain C4 / ATCC 48331 / race T) TaxID=665024 RepID=N4WGU9_COCH4|nr:uncharacterized protein COCC4DRAFT_66376 [Bipolaris maydis ATCC 48331]ENH99498.1 hypothetical protein COCC4DRAFT_66376 [Bipolaris maydis ATCC 48331]